MQARARVLMDPSVQSRRRQQELDADTVSAAPRDRLGALYASATASMLLRDFARAERAWADGVRLGVAALGPEDAKARQAWSQLGAELALEQGDAALAAQRLGTPGEANAPRGGCPRRTGRRSWGSREDRRTAQ